MAKKKSICKPGDLFGIPMGEDEYALGQVISVEKHCMDSILCCFSSVIVKDALPESLPFLVDDLISVQLVTRDSLDRGLWPILGFGEPLNVDALFPIKLLRENSYVGAKIKGSGIMEKFVLAYHGRSPWDEYFDPFHFDKLLLSGVVRPKGIIFKKA